ncbi:hypothetical protein BWQ96_08728 [Gracilariopsis chorda]|uniref:Uncharacterized protein n=1 Tax=Gracilariopsis chorda TaxID=448386 RepID=A0A2V3IHF0_9FLOR|nr:hypothetical protein BWQ96_08728 [Gracilariopsis chorda]|eukprot:PXF41525.1 hypothetical protein BWQ96_08728 [Gracilariopsis chorda]
MSHQLPPSPAECRAEKQIAPAIYFTPPPASVNLRPPPMSAATSYAHMTLPQLHDELHHLRHTVSMLRASNDEMRQLDPHHLDDDLTQAIGENVALIVRRDAHIQHIRRLIARLQPHCDHHLPQQQPQQRACHQPQPRSVSFAPHVHNAHTNAQPADAPASPTPQHGLYL